jgi:GTP pyrophosphokinase/guanosine-3',5'-bis(diphosphate) 3'-pyrophosphohydrolase
MPDTAVPQRGAAGVARQQRYLRQFELVDLVRGYDPDVEEDALNRAYVFATVAHGSQTRLSGDPYFAHPIQVAGILTEYGLDATTIIAGLLHDTIEDTPVTAEQIESQFGPAVARIVEGVTKLSKLELEEQNPEPTERQRQAANLRKFLLAMSKDIRVLLVKLADRLHNMRTLGYHPKPEKRRRIAEETIDIYAPLARRIGVERMAADLEDLSFAELHPQALADLTERIAALESSSAKAIGAMRSAIPELLETAGISSEVKWRTKRPYSIWKKLQRKGVEFGDLSDVIAFRAIVPTVADCYTALGLIHQRWPCVAERFADYISTPKANGYRSIHTTVLGPGQMRVEIQIRTLEMDRVSEIGVAAHFTYKTSGYGFDEVAAAADGLDPARILASLRDIVEHGGNADEFLEHARLEMFTEQIFCFTPKRRLIALPHGATAIDFAYGVHSSVGDTYLGAHVNGELRPHDWQLQNGDVVEIIRGNAPAMFPAFDQVARTGRALSAQRRLERLARRAGMVEVGRAYLESAFRRLGKSIKDVKLDVLAARQGVKTADDLLRRIGEDEERQLADKIARQAFPDAKAFDAGQRRPLDDTSAMLMIDTRGVAVGKERPLRLMPCCTPIPGDRIAGVAVPQVGIEVHVIDCERLQARLAEDYEWLDIGWQVEAHQRALATGRLEVSIENQRGALARCFALLSEQQANITNLKMLSRTPQLFRLEVDVEVFDREHLTRVLAALRTASVVKAAERILG